jgi:hypothetical protein
MRHADIKTTLAFYTNVDDTLAEAISESLKPRLLVGKRG